MNVRMKTAIALLLSVCLITASRAQTAPGASAQSDELVKMIQNLNKDHDDLKDAIYKLEERLRRTEEALKRQKEEGKGTAFKSQIKELRDSIGALAADYEKRLDCQQRTAAEEKAESAKRIEQLSGECAEKADSIAGLHAELEDLKVFKTSWLASLADGVGDKWLNRPYSAIGLSELERDCLEYDRFARWDETVAAARDKLDALIGEVRIYARGARLLSEPYDKAGVAECVVEVEALEAAVSDAGKKSELHELARRLNDYGITIEIFQDVIDAVDYEIKDQESHEAAWQLAKAQLKELEDGDQYISAIEKIPWLKERYEKYLERLERDCLGPNPVRDEIMELEP